MKMARALSEVEAKKVQTSVLLGGVFTTITIWTKLEDPINLPKMFVLVLFAAISLGLATPALLNAHKLSSINQRIGLGLVGLFAIGLIISTAATDVKYTAIFGEFHRNNGFLSYFAMIILMVSGSLVFNLRSVNRYFTFFGIAGLLLSFYGVLQGLGADPVGWRIDYNPFITTLGNPNFTSGFLGLSGIAILYLALDAKDRKFQVIYAVGLLAFAIAYATLGSTQNHIIALIALALYGLFPALTDGVGKAWIAGLSEDNHRGRAQGVYQASMNFAVLGAGIWGGALWSKGDIQWPLIIAAIGALIGAIVLAIGHLRRAQS